MKYNQFKNEFHSGCLSIYNGDCMDLLRQTPDKYYSLSIVDSPYGLGSKLVQGGTWSKKWQKKVLNGILFQMICILKNYLECVRIGLFGVEITIWSICQIAGILFHGTSHIWMGCTQCQMLNWHLRHLI